MSVAGRGSFTGTINPPEGKRDTQFAQQNVRREAGVTGEVVESDHWGGVPVIVKLRDALRVGRAALGTGG